MIRTSLICTMVLLGYPVTEGVAQTAQGQPVTQARYNYCAKTYGEDMNPGWMKNHCSKAPYGVRFERLRPAWDCLCH